MKIRIATRESALALWQARHVQEKLQLLDPDIETSLVPMTTEGDRRLAVSLAKEGGKGLFIKELEQALLDGRADIAVHSMKDLTVHLPDEFMIAAVLEREDPRDAFVSNQYQSLTELPKGAVLGTSSLRRQSQILNIRPDLKIKLLRGNVNTRLAKLDDGQYDAIILAAAGLKRLNLAGRVQEYLAIEHCLPAVGQGIMGVECCQQNQTLISVLKQLNHLESDYCLQAERAMNQALNGGCQVPIAGHAVLENNQIYLQGLIGSPSGSPILIANARGDVSNAKQLGNTVAEDLLTQGAAEILRDIYG